MKTTKISISAALILVTLLTGGCAQIMGRPYKLNFESIGIGLTQHTHAIGQARIPVSLSSAASVPRGRLLVIHYNSSDHKMAKKPIAMNPRDLAQLANLPGVVSAHQLESDWREHTLDTTGRTPLTLADLSVIARSERADLILLFTSGTQTDSTGIDGPLVLHLITLGLLPTDYHWANVSIDALLLDIDRGYIYGLYEGEGRAGRISNQWFGTNQHSRMADAATRDSFGNIVTKIQADGARQ